MFNTKSLKEKMFSPSNLWDIFPFFHHSSHIHKTKDILQVMNLLRHKNIKNTLIYTQLANVKDDEYVSRVAKNVQEACQLGDSGFEYVCD
jgi:site-specific recombinase XerC